jgi:hypothetical protein
LTYSLGLRVGITTGFGIMFGRYQRNEQVIAMAECGKARQNWLSIVWGRLGPSPNLILSLQPSEIVSRVKGGVSKGFVLFSESTGNGTGTSGDIEEEDQPNETACHDQFIVQCVHQVVPFVIKGISNHRHHA